MALNPQGAPMQQIAIGFRSSAFEQYAQCFAENDGPSNRRFIERARNGSVQVSA
jgi:hypothetical protein